LARSKAPPYSKHSRFRQKGDLYKPSRSEATIHDHAKGTHSLNANPAQGGSGGSQKLLRITLSRSQGHIECMQCENVRLVIAPEKKRFPGWLTWHIGRDSSILSLQSSAQACSWLGSLITSLQQASGTRSCNSKRRLERDGGTDIVGAKTWACICCAADFFRERAIDCFCFLRRRLSAGPHKWQNLQDAPDLQLVLC